MTEHAHPLEHVAIIMDGNNRWAKQQGLEGIAGHERGVERVRDVLDGCHRHGVEILTLFAFSSENWRRPAMEVRALMSLLASYLKKECKPMADQGIRLRVIGLRDRFSPRLCKLIEEVELATCNGTRQLVLAIDYGGRWDITQAAQKLARQVQTGRLRPENISEALLEQQLSFADLPMPDLCIRTAGERRISNFLLWQLAYAELYFADCYWPDFDGHAFDKAVEDYNNRQRRFGKTSDQLAEESESRKTEQANA